MQRDLKVDVGVTTADGEPTLKRPAVSPRSRRAEVRQRALALGQQIARHWWERFRRSPNGLPFALLAAFLLATLITVVTQAHRYGITLDEPLMQGFGVYIAKFYHSLAKDRSFLTPTGVGQHQPEHGGVFDAGVVAIENIFSGVNLWLVRHTVCGIAGWVGLIGMALCGYEIAGPWLALAAAAGLWFFPRYTGAMYNNSKDIPATAAMAFVIWATILLIKRWNHRERAILSSVLLGVCIGAATAIRATALSWFAVLLVLLAGWWLFHGRDVWRERRLGEVIVQHLVVVETLVVATFIAIMALWPYVYVDPFVNLHGAINVLTHYPWQGDVLFGGHVYLATQLPRSYVPTWIVIGSPPILLALAALGGGVIVVETVRYRRVDVPAWVALIGFAVSLAPLLLLHPTLYDTLRQFLYIFPPLILLAGYGLVRAFIWLRRQPKPSLRWAAVALLVVTLIGYAQVAVEMVRLAPYEYAYFSPLVGGLQGAAGKYDTDYYGTCTKAAGEWLAQNYQRYTTNSAPSLAVEGGLITPYVPSSFAVTAVTETATGTTTPTQPDFFVSYTRDHHDLEYPTYRTIHVVATEGVTLCVVKVNPALAT